MSIPHFAKAGPQGYTGGQPSKDDFEELIKKGVQHVVNLRPPTEGPDFNEANITTAYGMAYYNIPIANAEDLTHENVNILEKVFQRVRKNETLFIHCASSNRVGALMALHNAWVQGARASEALNTGEKWGLGSLWAPVQQWLQDEEDEEKESG